MVKNKKEARSLISRLHFFGVKSLPHDFESPGWLAGSVWLLCETGMDWLPSFHPGILSVFQKKANIVLTQQPEHTDHFICNHFGSYE